MYGNKERGLGADSNGEIVIARTQKERFRGYGSVGEGSGWGLGSPGWDYIY